MTPRTAVAFAAAATVAVAAAVAGGLWLLGSPQAQREQALDERRVSALRVLTRNVDLYWTRHQRLPQTLDELSRVTEPLRQQVSRAATSSAFFMYQIQGATSDPSRIASVRTLLGDYTQTTPQRMQELARAFLAPNRRWQLAVMPEGEKLPAVASVR